MKTINFLIILFFTILFFGCSSSKNLPYGSPKNYFSYINHYNAVVNRLYGNIDYSKKTLYEILKYERNNPAVIYELGLCNIATENYDEAIFLIERAKQIDTTNMSLYVDNLLRLYDIQNQDTKATYLLEEVLQKRPSSTNYILSYTHFLLKQNKVNTAETLLKTKIEQYNNPDLISVLAEIFIQTQKLDSALVLLNKLELLYSDNIEILAKQASIYAGQGKDSAALDKYNQIIFINPNEPRALYSIIQKDISNQNSENVKQNISNFLNNSYINEEIKLYLLFDLIKNNNFYKKNTSYIDSLKIELDERNILNLNYNKILFGKYLQENQLENARLVNLNILRINSSDYTYWESLVQIEYNLKNYNNLHNVTENAIKIFPYSSFFYIIKSVAYQEFGFINEAINVLESATKKINESNELSDIYSTLADMYYKINKKKKAFKLYELSIKKNKNNFHALNNYSYFLSLDKKQLNKALNLINKVVVVNPNNSTYLDTKGWVLFKLGRYEEAKETLRQALLYGGQTSPVILEHYGDALFKTGSKDSAYIYWLKAKELGGSDEKLLIKIKTMKYVE
jgi:tetratricopeptide (TPR) repeat protein